MTLSKRTRTINLVGIIVAAVALVCWFLPILSAGAFGFSVSYNLFTLMEYSSDVAPVCIITLVFFAALVLWTIFPKKWAAILAIVFSAIDLILAIVIMSAASGGVASPTFFGILIYLCSIASLVLAILKTVFIGKDANAPVAETEE